MTDESAHRELEETLKAADPRLLVYSSRLLKFSLAELACYAQVDHGAAHAFIVQNVALFRALGAAPASASVDTLWQLRPEVRDAVAARAAELVRLGALVNDDKGTDMTTMPDAMELLEETLQDLAGEDIADPEERRTECELAGIYLEAAEANVRDRERLSLPIDPSVRDRIQKAQATLAALNAPPPRNERSQPDPRWFKYELAFLLDWIALGSQASTVAHDSVDVAPDAFTLDKLLGMVVPSQHSASAGFVQPALAIHRKIDRVPAACKDELAAAIRQRLAQPIAQHGMLAALGTMAAVLDDACAAQPLFAAILAAAPEALGQDEYEAALLALARLARPRERLAAGSVPAAAACAYLLSAKELPAEQVALLAPAAMCSPAANACAILHMAAEAIFDQYGMKRDCAKRLGEEALMRNFALALYSQAFAPLRRDIATLMQTTHGIAFVRSLCDPQHCAMIITDANGSDYRVRAHQTLFEYSALEQIEPFPLKILRTSRAGEVLERIVREHRRAEQREQPPPHGPLGSSADERAATSATESLFTGSFVQLLRNKRHAQSAEAVSDPRSH